MIEISHHNFWFWISSSKWSTEPNNSGGTEDCVEIHKDGLYNDRQCDAKVGYICEYTLEYGKFVQTRFMETRCYTL